MIINIASTVLFFIFLTLATIHFYWVFGGKWGLKNAIPTKKENENINFKPSSFATFLVGLFLTLFACFYLIQANFIAFTLPKWASYLLWVLPSVFLLRSIGDFKYVGFFKQIKTTVFAKSDTKLFSPLCFTISFLGFLIAYLN